MTDTTRPHDVVVIGCGLMGSAIARTLAAAGASVAAWNRTHSKAEALASDGITAVRDIRDAIAAAPLIVGCTTAYDVLWAQVADVDSGWADTTFVNLTTGTPSEADEMEERIAAKGARYLDGMIVCYPEGIGTDHGFICYSGPATVWAHHSETLMKLGGATQHLSTNIRAANLMAVWYAAFYVSSLAAYVEAVAFACDQGVTREEIDSLTPMLIDLLSHAAPAISYAVTSGDHDTDQATVDTFLDGSAPALGEMRSAGHVAGMYTAALSSMRVASTSGLGARGFSALALSGKQPSPA